jgi:hypothetical protein
MSALLQAFVDELEKIADIKTPLLPHQQRVVDRLQQDDQPGLVAIHGLGSGKTLTSIAAQDALHMPAQVVAPAALLGNYRKEQSKHLSGKKQPTQLTSMQNMAAKGVPVLPTMQMMYGPNSKKQIPHFAANMAAGALGGIGTGYLDKHKRLIALNELDNQRAELAERDAAKLPRMRRQLSVLEDKVEGSWSKPTAPAEKKDAPPKDRSGKNW